MKLETIYDLTTNVILCHILHISNGNIYGTQYEIMKKCHYSIKNVNAYKLCSTTEC